MPFSSWLDLRRDYAALFIRLAIGTRLIAGTQDNVFSYARMVEFSHFLAANGTPFPLAGAFVSAYAQFVCGALFILGLWTRPAAVVMAINFVAALAIAHRETPFEATWPALMMLAAALFFLFHGAGRPSLDASLAARRGRALADRAGC
jgi:putative oxidoreductase